MKKIGVYYFSGTGNTEIVARMLASALQSDDVNMVELRKVEDVTRGKINLAIDGYDIIGIGHPVLGFGSPGIMRNFIKNFPSGGGKKVFIFKTAADFHWINYDASGPLINILRAKGYDVLNDTLLAMPSNFLIRFEDNMCRQLYEALPEKILKLSEDILNEERWELPMNGLLRVICRIMNFGEDRIGAKVFGRGLRASSKCNGCRKCIKNCPVENIAMPKGEIVFGNNCIMCMRCVYACPQNAIYASRLSSFVLDNYNGGENIYKLLNAPENAADFVTESTRGYYKHFRGYLNK